MVSQGKPWIGCQGTRLGSPSTKVGFGYQRCLWMSPMFPLHMHSAPSLPLFGPDIDAFLKCSGVIIFFRKDRPQTEGRRNAHPLIKTWLARGAPFIRGLSEGLLKGSVPTGTGSQYRS